MDVNPFCIHIAVHVSTIHSIFNFETQIGKQKQKNGALFFFQYIKQVLQNNTQHTDHFPSMVAVAGERQVGKISGTGQTSASTGQRSFCSQQSFCSIRQSEVPSLVLLDEENEEDNAHGLKFNILASVYFIYISHMFKSFAIDGFTLTC